MFYQLSYVNFHFELCRLRVLYRRCRVLVARIDGSLLIVVIGVLPSDRQLLTNCLLIRKVCSTTYQNIGMAKRKW